MCKKIIVLLFLITISFSLFSQEFRSKEQVDALTYNLYLKKDWKNLIQTGKAALKQNHDFYYLRYRLAIAYYETKNYERSARLFEKLVSETPKDDVLNEYLYYSYFFAGRFEDARVFAFDISAALKEKLNIRPRRSINAIGFDAKLDFNEDYVIKESFGVDIEQSAVKNQNYFGLNMEHLIGNRTTFFHGYTRIGITNIVQSDLTSNYPPQFDEKTKQNEYYATLNIHAAKGTDISLGFHYLNINLSAEDLTLTVGPGRNNNYLYNTYKNSFVGFLGFSKRFSVFNTGISASVSNSNSQIQFQPEFSLVIYPLGNYKFYTRSVLREIIHSSKLNSENNFVVQQSVGILMMKRVLFEPSISYGKMYNFVEYRGIIVNNDTDPILFRAEGMLNFFLAKGKFNLFIKYQYNKKDNFYFLNEQVLTKSYINQSLTGGIKWYF